MPFSTSTPAQPEQVSQPVRIPPPTAAQQLVLDRIEQQRERLRARRAAHDRPRGAAQELVPAPMEQQRKRLRARRAAHDRPLAVAESHAGAGADESLVLRTAWFVREHPWAVAAMVLLAAVAGPRRLVRWAGVLLPVLVRLKR